MKSGHLAGAIGLIIFSASIGIPVKGHSADLLGGIGSVAKELLRLEAQKTATSAKQKTATSANKQSTTISPDETLRTQQALKAKGISPGPIDGIDGEQTRAAIRTYQRDNGWPVTGTLTAAQRSKLLGHVDPGAAAIATGLVPLLLNDGGSSSTNSAGAVQERNTPTVSTGLDGGTTDDLTARRKSRVVTGDGGTAPIGGTGNAGTTATVTEGKNLNTTAGDSQQSLKSLLTTSTQPSGDESTTTTERTRLRTRTATSVDSTTETRRKQTGAAAGDVSRDNAGRAGTGDGVTTIDCAIASRRAGRCPPTQ